MSEFHSSFKSHLPPKAFQEHSLMEMSPPSSFEIPCICPAHLATSQSDLGFSPGSSQSDLGSVVTKKKWDPISHHALGLLQTPPCLDDLSIPGPQPPQGELPEHMVFKMTMRRFQTGSGL